MAARRRRRRARRLAALAMCAAGLLALAVPGRPARAQRLADRVLVQGILDLEGWATDSGSTLLTRNGGGASGLARLQAWTAWEPRRGLVLFLQSEVEGGPARAHAEKLEVYVDNYGVRYAQTPALVIDLGKMPHPIGAFATRRFSTRNPLIGAPDAYPVEYPFAAQLSGTKGIVDYRAALVSRPVFHEDYVPTPTESWRPVAGVGITPFMGLRVGVAGTSGPYLDRAMSPARLAHEDWRRYRQHVVSADAHFSRGYLETHAELARSSYEVPRRATAVYGKAYYVEAKYTATPRLFVAARWEDNDYPFIRATGDSAWIARATHFSNAEVGIGVHLSASTLGKVSMRKDWWELAVRRRGFAANGNAVAIQLSRRFDVMDLLRRER